MSQRLRPMIWLTVLFCLIATSGPLQAVVTSEDDAAVGAKAYRHPGLLIRDAYQPLIALPAKAAADAHVALDQLGITAQGAHLDARSGRFETLMPAQPLLPGDGLGNTLSWSDLKSAAPRDSDGLKRAAWNAFAAYLAANASALSLDLDQLSAASRVTVHGGGDLIQIHTLRAIGGVAVRNSYLSAVINHGNLSLLGAHRWGDATVSTAPDLSIENARDAAETYLGATKASRWSKPRLSLLPTAAADGYAIGAGYTYRLAWVLRPTFEGQLARWEMLVDAHSGEILSFEDTNHYRRVQGGVYPVSNDGTPPDGVEQAGWPMPFDDVTTTSGTLTTDSGGNLPIAVTGNITSNLSGPFVNINDNCGAISLTASSGDIDFGTSGGDDCTTPGFGGAGNTHSSRSGFYELNRIIEMGRSHLPSNTWLQQTLTANMNINLTCNAFWGGGTVNFYRSGGGCGNTGEIAAIFDHEWGHGMDDNDANGFISDPGESLADIYAHLRLATSCVGRGFSQGSACGGYGDPCTNDCDGVRDIDWANHASGAAHTIANYVLDTQGTPNGGCQGFGVQFGPCGGETHCEGMIGGEAVFDLVNRDLPAAGFDSNTSLEIGTRLTFLGSGTIGDWYTCNGNGNDGCSATGGYLSYLVADDDNGNLSDGTPHIEEIFAAFDRHGIACNTPTPTNSGCAGSPTTAPSVTGNPLDKSASLSWGAVAGASKYQVFRTEGVFACDFGKIKAGETTGTSFVDNELQNGRAYSYVVIPIGPNDTCMGPASSCTNVTPAAGPNLDIDAGSAVLAITSGDGDEFLDNCETATLSFDVNNTGIGGLTNVRITAVTPTSHPSITVTTGLPAAVSPSSLAEGATGTGSFDFSADGLSFNDTVTFQVEVTADEISPIVKTADLTVLSAESDFQAFASKTYTFEGGTEGWQVIQGTFNRTSSGGGAQSTTWYEASSANLDDQCDHIRSPILSLNASSTMELFNQFDIEPFYSLGGVWYDRANVGIYEVAGGNRTAVSPSSGRLYNASGVNGSCGTTGEAGWADAQTTWDSSSWNAAALGSAGVAGQQVQLDVRYGTDASLNGFGFHFDQVTLTDFSEQVVDGQSDSCSGCTSNAQCDDGAFCNGAETCDIPSGLCQAGTAPNCDDGVSCTDDSCNEGTDSCDNIANNANCDDGAFCNGAETCDPVLDCQAGSDPCFPLACDEGGDICVGGASAQLESDCLSVGGSAVTVGLTNTYVSAVVTTSVQYSNNTTPVVPRVSSVTATSFDVRLQNPSGGAVAADSLCYLVVEEGTWTMDGVAVEAQRYTSTVTDDAPTNWVGQAQTYGQSYTAPVVLGQVMSEADAGFSVFWDMATTRTAPPTASLLTTGKTVCEDTDITRADETVGFVVIESGHGTLGGVEYEAATGADTVAGVSDAPPYTYTFNTAFATAPTVATVQMAAVDGNNGGWAQVHGSTLATTTSLFLSIDEDQIGDSERNHTSEQVAYVAFAGPVVFPDVGCTSNAQCDDNLFCNGVETCDIPSGICQAGTPPVCDDGVSCTDDSCNEGTDSCDNIANNANCDDGAFCNGAETCDPVLDCQAGTPPVCDDGVSCTDDSCNEGTDSCDNVANNANCDDGLFCNGSETCDPVLDCQAGSDPCPGQSCDEGGNICIGSDVMEWGAVSVGSSAVTVNLTGSYTSPVIVTAVQYDNNTIPVVTRISSVTGTSFDILLQNAGAGSVVTDTVSYLVVEEGVHTVNGTLIEAQTYTSTVTDENNSWVGQAQSLAGSFTNPVVLGQVMSSNDADWSVFWDQGTTRQNPPIASALTTGKAVCEDTLTARADETVGFVVIEAGHGTLGGVEFEAALGADSVQGVGNSPPYTYTFNTAFATAPSVSVVTMAGIDGGNGGWAYTFGPAPTSTTSLDLAIDEDTIGDSERNHITEQVGYVVFATAGSASP